jgi:hypothetical protein
VSEAPFGIPAEFLAGRVVLTPAELRYGFTHGWLGSAEVVQVALAGYGSAEDAAYTELALLLSDQFDRVPELAELLPTAPNASRVWLYLALAWVYEHRTDFPDPLGVVEMLYDDFDYPEEIEGFVRFMPARESEPTGIPALYERWERYLSRVSAEYKKRPAAS